MTQSRLKFAFLLAPAIAVLASGCANRHSVTVGAVPVDYNVASRFGGYARPA